jgi:hypothetical protein
MFDFLHGQTGVAPNGIELHPVLDIAFTSARPVNVPPSIAAPEPLEGADPDTVAVNDDDWRVEIVPPFAVGARAPVFHGGPVVREPSAQLVFFGDWSVDSARPAQLETSVSAFVRSVDYQVWGGQAPWSVNGRTAPLAYAAAPTTLNDLDVQAQLERLLRSGGMASSRQGTVYVLLLPPGVESTLGEYVGGHDYLAYHNVLNGRTGRIYYTVVPYDRDADRYAGTVTRALSQTVLNPEGTGWY